MSKEKKMKKLPEGHFNVELEGPLMISAINAVKSLAGGFVEIGSLFGRSAVLLGQQLEPLGAKLTCIDVWGECEHELKDEIGEAIKYYPARPTNSFEIFEENIRRFHLEDVVDPIQERAEIVFQSWGKPLRFIFIDGCHEYEFVKKDALWKKFLVDKGIMIFHDYHTPWHGVRKAVDEIMDSDPDFIEFASSHTIKAFVRLRSGR